LYESEIVGVLGLMWKMEMSWGLEMNGVDGGDLREICWEFVVGSSGLDSRSVCFDFVRRLPDRKIQKIRRFGISENHN